MELSPFSVDNAWLKDLPSESSIECIKLDEIHALPSDKHIFIGTSERTRDVQTKFESECRRGHGFPVGIVRLRNVSLVGPTGLILQTNDRRYLHGSSIGWGSGHAAALDHAALHLGAAAGNGSILEIRETRLKSARHVSTALLLSSPGFAIYGHWLIDVLPRHILVEEHLVPHNAAHYAPRAPRWGARLLDACRLKQHNPLIGTSGEVVTIDELLVPTYIRHGCALDTRRSIETWGRLRAGLSREPNAIHDASTMIYVSRSRLKQGRALVNSQTIEALLAREGFVIIHPQELTIAQQAAAFSKARIIVGEDGSGLHNCIFSPDSAHIIVISMGRSNAYHAGIANCTGQKLSYLDAEYLFSSAALPGNASWEMNPELLMEEVGRISRIAG